METKWTFEPLSNKVLNNFTLDLITLWFKDEEFAKQTIDIVDPNYSSSKPEIMELIAVIKEYVKQFGYSLDIDVIFGKLDNQYKYFASEETHSELRKLIEDNVVSENRKKQIVNTYQEFYNVYLALAKGRNMLDEFLNSGFNSKDNFYKKTQEICSYFNNVWRTLNYIQNDDNEW